MTVSDSANATPSLTYSIQFGQTFWDFGDLVLKTRFAEALERGVARYPILRTLRFAARIHLETLFDDIALNLGWNAQRMRSSQMLLDAEGLLISAHGTHKQDYCSCFFSIWSDTPERAQEAMRKIEGCAADKRIREPMFAIDWNFLTGKGELQSASIEELADDVLLDEAYPEIAGGVHRFIGAYLDANETVLVVQGPPGTGKTRLIRAILGEISRRKGREAQALYTGDRKSLENDEIFVKFITGWDDAFVVEDADHILRPRAQGNEHLHRFLAIADGVVRSQGRKIIFSTNLPNVGDLDDALIRPGRCFARLHVRELTHAEAEAVVATLCAGDDARAERSCERLAQLGRKSVALADIYRSCADGR
jgi:ATPase family protein associated with various cellular activities (AAA)